MHDCLTVIDTVSVLTPPLHRHTSHPDGRHFSGFAFCLLLITVLMLFACSNTRTTPTTARAATGQAVPVGVATAERRDMPVYLTGLGSVTAFNTVSVRTRVDGQLQQVNFKEGQGISS